MATLEAIWSPGIGCERGRARAIAALCGFERLKGIECRADLLADAERNLESVAARTGRLDHELRLADALDHAGDPSDQILYLYDPFDQATTRAFFGRILEFWRANPRPLHVVHHNNPLGDSCPGHEVFRGWPAETRDFLDKPLLSLPVAGVNRSPTAL